MAFVSVTISSRDEERVHGFPKTCLPLIAMILVQLGFTGSNILSKIALTQGMHPLFFVFYRHVIATFFMLPFAIYFERKTWGNITWSIAAEIFVSAMLGCTLTQGFYFYGMQYSSPTLVCAIGNLVPVVTFILALLFRMEKLRTDLATMGKVVGTVVIVSGGIIMTVYTGVMVWNPSFGLKPAHSTEAPMQIHDNVKAAMFAFASCFCVSSWSILQTKIGSHYSGCCTSTTLMCFFAMIQGAIATMIMEGTDSSVWHFGWNYELLAAVYAGVVISSTCFAIKAWCIRERGALYLAAFSPVEIVMVAFLSTFFLDENLYLGSILGATLITVGAYGIVWGKRKDRQSFEAESTVSGPAGTVGNADGATPKPDLEVGTPSQVLNDIRVNAEANELPWIVYMCRLI